MSRHSCRRAGSGKSRLSGPSRNFLSSMPIFEQLILSAIPRASNGRGGACGPAMRSSADEFLHEGRRDGPARFNGASCYAADRKATRREGRHRSAGRPPPGNRTDRTDRTRRPARKTSRAVPVSHHGGINPRFLSIWVAESRGPDRRPDRSFASSCAIAASIRDSIESPRPVRPACAGSLGWEISGGMRACGFASVAALSRSTPGPGVGR